MSQYNIMTILVNHRRDNAKDVQALLTKFGCNIKVRLGLHEISNVCAEDGLIVLQLGGEMADISAFKEALNHLDGVQAKLTTFEFEEQK